MNEQDLRSFYDRVGKLNGWDFSRVSCRTEGAAWDFYEEVSRRCSKSELVLDIGTGGGEALLSIAGSALLAVGIDCSAGMVEAAEANLARSEKTNVRFLQMEADALQFPDGFFQVVSSRHSPFHANEIARVLAADGLFLTQQVSEGDKRNLKQAFRRGQSYGVPDGTLKLRYLAELENAGFTDIQAYDYDAVEYYQSDEDLVFILKHTPIIPNFGGNGDDFTVLDAFIKQHRTEKGIRTNSKRFMIMARK